MNACMIIISGIALAVATLIDPAVAKDRAHGGTPLSTQRPECVRFRWEPDPTRKGALSIPVTLNGRAMWFQLDTGTNTDIVYGKVADEAGWASQGAKSFRAAEMRIGSTLLRNVPVAVYRSQPVEQTAGEIGLADLVGRVTVIDYPAQQFCLFEPGRAPEALLAEATWTEGALRNGKFFLPLSIGNTAAKDAIFDTGSSEFPLWVDLPIWRQITGLNDTAAAKQEVRGNNFNKPVIFKGASTVAPLKIGPVSVGSRTAYTKVGDPNMFAAWPYPVTAIIGNEPFWDGVIILDLSDSKTRFGIVTPRP